jgi:dTDP-4-amino-4,6-dideoxygalactose transaminase
MTKESRCFDSRLCSRAGRRETHPGELKKRGLGATGSYPVPLNELPGAADYFDRKEVYPNAKYISERIMTLPLHEYVTERDIERLTTLIKKSVLSFEC